MAKRIMTSPAPRSLTPKAQRRGTRFCVRCKVHRPAMQLDAIGPAPHKYSCNDQPQRCLHPTPGCARACLPRRVAKTKLEIMRRPTAAPIREPAAVASAAAALAQWKRQSRSPVSHGRPDASPSAGLPHASDLVVAPHAPPIRRRWRGGALSANETQVDVSIDVD